MHFIHTALWAVGIMVAVVLVALAVAWGFGVYAKNAYPDLDHPPRHPWRAVRAQGGGSISSPTDMTEAEALEWTRTLGGSIIYVDREAGIIFYRPE